MTTDTISASTPYRPFRNKENSIFLPMPIPLWDKPTMEFVTWMIENVGPYAKKWRYVWIGIGPGVYVPNDVAEEFILIFKLKYSV